MKNKNSYKSALAALLLLSAVGAANAQSREAKYASLLFDYINIPWQYVDSPDNAGEEGSISHPGFNIYGIFFDQGNGIFFQGDYYYLSDYNRWTRESPSHNNAVDSVDGLPLQLLTTKADGSVRQVRVLRNGKLVTMRMTNGKFYQFTVYVSEGSSSPKGPRFTLYLTPVK